MSRRSFAGPLPEIRQSRASSLVSSVLDGIVFEMPRHVQLQASTGYVGIQPRIVSERGGI